MVPRREGWWKKETKKEGQKEAMGGGRRAENGPVKKKKVVPPLQQADRKKGKATRKQDSEKKKRKEEAPRQDTSLAYPLLHAMAPREEEEEEGKSHDGLPSFRFLYLLPLGLVGEKSLHTSGVCSRVLSFSYAPPSTWCPKKEKEGLGVWGGRRSFFFFAV